MASDAFTDPAPRPDDDGVGDVDPTDLLDELSALGGLAVTAESLARRLRHHDVHLDRTQRSALETCVDNANAIVASLQREL